MSQALAKRGATRQVLGTIGWVVLAFAGVAIAAPESSAQQEVGHGGARKSDSVVQIHASADHAGNGQQLVTVTLDIQPHWHLYANSVGKDFPGIPTTVSVAGRSQPELVKVDYPEGTLVRDSVVGDHHVYEGKITIKALVRRGTASAGPLDVSVQVQACNKERCLLPATVTLQVP